MDEKPKIEGRKLVIARMMGVAMIIAFANDAYNGYITLMAQIESFHQ